ncbi:hypothetical protein [Tenacibaculum amylolyticum]|uniref:hypothetical protein n=1 Tax=Tenacibaculum amylolyticum TaxID=104269 RepID=UPI0038950223
MVIIDQLNIDSGLKKILKSRLEQFEAAKNMNVIINHSMNEEVVTSNEEFTETASDNIRRKLNDFFNKFFFSEYEEELV